MLQSGWHQNPKALTYTMGIYRGLNELNLIPKLDAISSVSGGAVFFCLSAWKILGKWDSRHLKLENTLLFLAGAGLVLFPTDPRAQILVQFCISVRNVFSSLLFHNLGLKPCFLLILAGTWCSSIFVFAKTFKGEEVMVFGMLSPVL